MESLERWRPVVGFEGRYEVSDLGNVRSVDREVEQLSARGQPYRKILSGQVLAAGIGSPGYPTVVLGRGNTRTVHSLVAEAFLGPCPEGQEVLHKDGTRTNCALWNLFYGTRSENNEQIVHDGRRKLTIGQIREIIRALDAGAAGADLARRFGVSQSHISAIRNGVHYSRFTGRSQTILTG